MDFNYSNEPKHGKPHTAQYDQFYTRFAPIYDRLVKTLPIWRNWIGAAVPFIQGRRICEISFGTGYLLTQYAGRLETYGIDYNWRMARIALTNLSQAGLKASLQVADAAALPYREASFDTIINTMAFTAYPDGKLALSEMRRVLRPEGRIVMIDICYPQDGNRLGTFLTNAWKAGGDIIRDMPALFEQSGFEFLDREIGGYGSVHLYVATKQTQKEAGA